MPIVAVAVCPHPPLLVPELAPGDDAILSELRAACAAAVDRLADAAPTELYVIGAGTGATRIHPPGSRGSFTGYGPAVEVTFSGGTATAEAPAGETPATEVSPRNVSPDGLPLALLAGGWLAARSGLAGLPTTGVAVPADLAPDECAALGREIAGTTSGGAAADPAPADPTARRALLVMGDGSARHSEHAPAHLDPRAEAFDATVAGALETADTGSLARLDPTLAAELAAQGRAAWQVLAGAAGTGRWTASLDYAASPFGVGYFVATWFPAG
jgi:hypothetical protein